MNITFEQGWVFVDHLAVYPRDDGTFSVGQPTGKPREYYDVSVGYENQDAAIDQAIWFATEGLAPLPSAVPSECKQTPEWVLRSDAPTGIHSDQQPQVKGMASRFPFPINQQTPD